MESVMKSILAFKDLEKSYDNNKLFHHLSFEINEGDRAAIIGKSGSGKSTLLNIIGFLDYPSSGDYYFNSIRNINIHSTKARKILRDKIGYMFQNYALLDNETIEKNLLIAMHYGKYDNKKKAIKDALISVGLESMEKRKIHTLSGGEQQRVAIARLIVKPCEIILADEPTGNLDDYNRDEIVKLLLKLNEQGKTIIMVTHDHSLLEYFDKVVDLDAHKPLINEEMR